MGFLKELDLGFLLNETKAFAKQESESEEGMISIELEPKRVAPNVPRALCICPYGEKAIVILLNGTALTRLEDMSAKELEDYIKKDKSTLSITGKKKKTKRF